MHCRSSYIQTLRKRDLPATNHTAIKQEVEAPRASMMFVCIQSLVNAWIKLNINGEVKIVEDGGDDSSAATATREPHENDEQDARE